MGLERCGRCGRVITSRFAYLRIRPAYKGRSSLFGEYDRAVCLPCLQALNEFLEVPQPLVDKKIEDEIKRRVDEELRARLAREGPPDGLLKPVRERRGR